MMSLSYDDSAKQEPALRIWPICTRSFSGSAASSTKGAEHDEAGPGNSRHLIRDVRCAREFAPGRSVAYIMAEAIPLVGKLQEDQGIEVEVKWVQAHIGARGNEAADRAAKRAVKRYPEPAEIPRTSHEQRYNT
jgi:hypothetical protein